MAGTTVILTLQAQACLEALIERWDPLGELRARNGCVVPVTESSSPTRTRRRIRLPGAGCLIRRTYKGRVITVRVLEHGFEYDGKRYRSLSGVARAVTGAKWNGNLFFGFVRQQKVAVTDG